MMKKLTFLAIAAAMVLTFTACGNSSNETPSIDTNASMAIDEVQDTFEGLCVYLMGNGIISGTPLHMNSEIIGASDGRQYLVTLNKGQINIELYEFDFAKLEQISKDKGYDLEKLTELAKKNLESIRTDGQLQITEKDSVPAMISNNGKYVMLYTDPETNEEHTAQRQKAETLFKEFKN